MLTRVEREVWAAWNALPASRHPSPVKAIARQLDMTPADVAFVVYPAETFGRWEDDQEPALLEPEPQDRGLEQPSSGRARPACRGDEDGTPA